VTVQPMGEGDASKQVHLPDVFLAPIRADIVQFVHTNMAKNARQAYSVNKYAGHQSSAEAPSGRP
jgi:large subunit ribosomal protein L4e